MWLIKLLLHVVELSKFGKAQDGTKNKSARLKKIVLVWKYKDDFYNK